MIYRDGKDVYMVPDRLPFDYAVPASWAGRITRLQRDSTLPTLVPSTTVALTTAGSLVAGEVRLYRFQYSDATLQERLAFSLVPDIGGGAADFPSIIDILEDRDEEVVVVHPNKPRKIASSYAPGGLGQGSFAGNPGAPQNLEFGTAIYGFNPADYGRGVDFYRLRVRGIPTPHPWFRFRVGQGGDFTLAYWKHQSLLDGFRIQIWPKEPAVGEEVFFRAIPPSGGIPAGTTYLWDFGDTNSGIGQQVSNTYVSDSSFTVKLTLDNTTPLVKPLGLNRLLTVVADDVRTRRAFGLAKSP